MVKEAAQGWSTPPAGTEDAKQGYRDGIQPAKLDTIVKRRLNANVSHLCSHPPAKGNDAVTQYCQWFEAGYSAALAHSGSPDTSHRS
jgi:hypothetical protein